MRTEGRSSTRSDSGGAVPPAPGRRHSSNRAASVRRELARLVRQGEVLSGTPREYLVDATEARGLRGHADAVVLPATAEEAASVLGWCYERGIPVVPRGGGTGYAGGCVPLGGVVIATDLLNRICSFDPLLWRIEVEAGLRTAELRRIARESGLLFPPDPGAAEQSHIGGNIATNAGGPHAFKYGVTGAWVTGLEAVIPPGEIIRTGGFVRKDVSGLDLKSLLIGSEGVLGLITRAWCRLVPAPEATLPVVAFYADSASGCAALAAVLGNGVTPAALEYLDGGTLALAGGSYPGAKVDGAGFMVIAEADGSVDEAQRTRDDLVAALSEDALRIDLPEAAALWRWRDGVSIVVTSARGGKVSEDIAVPLDRLAEAVQETIEIGKRHELSALSWGHAGDGNLHSTFLIAPHDEAEVVAAQRAAEDLFELALRLGGTISGEHGVGIVKRSHTGGSPRIHSLSQSIKATFDPKGLVNPGKKL
jgi:FAD/FMN-containing dehydrogenase